MNKFIFTTMTNSFVCVLGEFEDTKNSFRNYLTFKNPNWRGTNGGHGKKLKNLEVVEVVEVVEVP